MTDCHDAHGSDDEMAVVHDPKYNNEMQRLLSFSGGLNFSLTSRLAKHGFYADMSKNIVICQFCRLKLVSSDMGIEPHVCDKTANVELLSNTSDYRYENNRILSFLRKNWPKKSTETVHVGALDLARSGFYYTGKADAARCNFCRLEVRGWERGDTAESEHRRWNPHCTLSRRSVGNIPLGEEHDSAEHYIFVPDQRSNIAKSGASVQSCFNLGIHQHSPAIHPKFTSLASRLDSYNSWPLSLAQPLAESGYYYTGIGDQVNCFHCGGGLNALDETARGCYPNFNYELHRLLSFPDVLDFSLKTHLAKLGFYLSPDNTASCYFCPVTLDPVTSDMVVEPHVCNKTANIELPKITDDYRNGVNRILSFLKSNWPIQPNETVHVGALDLARWGFYCIGDGDAARCYFCRLEVRGWEKGDTALSEHRRSNPRCPFLRNQDLGVGLLQPAFPQYQNYRNRRDSYDDWPMSIVGKYITKHSCALTGLFYAGKSDVLICFDCGLGLQDWSPNEVPSVAHAVWSPACYFLGTYFEIMQQYRLQKRIDIPGAAGCKMIIIPQGLQTYTSRPLNDQMWDECMREMNNTTTTSNANFCQASGNYVWRAK